MSTQGMLVFDPRAQTSTAIERPRAGIALFQGPARGYAPSASDWIFKDAWPVRVEREDDGTWIAVDERFGNYGQGRSWSELVADFTLALIGHYRILEAADDPQSREVFMDLQAHFGPLK